MEQRVNLKFFVKQGNIFTEAYAMLKELYGNECLSRTQVFEGFKRFKEERETTEDDPRPGRPSISINYTSKRYQNKLIVIMCLYNGLAAVDYLQSTENVRRCSCDEFGP
ncbi:hypothetical protein NQ318_011774 [Aromia moschata]|uniref:Mos1 transposase HTH domain-containing protein n=1 Tax=Aromia moschata TaxID=1265417 RepID=A0AAV8Y114_9CUCU|nr:hypothetical protein NQ318_011774 [Aromia moschata]